MDMIERFKIVSLQQRNMKFNSYLEQRVDTTVRMAMLNYDNKTKCKHWHLYVLWTKEGFEIHEKRGKTDRYHGKTFEGSDVYAQAYISELIQKTKGTPNLIQYHRLNLKKELANA